MSAPTMHDLLKLTPSHIIGGVSGKDQDHVHDIVPDDPETVYTDVANTFTEVQTIRKDAAEPLIISRDNSSAVGTGINFTLGTSTPLHYASIYGHAVTSSPRVGKITFFIADNGSPTQRLEISATGALTLAEGGNLVLGTTTGTKIGTATAQKIGFFNATPVVQRTGIANVNSSTVDNTYGQQENDVITDLRTKVNAIIQVLEDLGLTATV